MDAPVELDYLPLAETVDPFSSLKGNLFVFLNDIYTYYEQKGFWHIFLSQVFSFLAVEFSIGLLFFVFFAVNYEVLWATLDLAAASYIPSVPALASVGTLASVYFVYQFIRSILVIRSAYNMRQYCSKALNLTDGDLQSMQWSDVVDIIKTDRLNIHKKDVTALDVIQIMMRKDNYMIGMMNKGVLNYNLPCSNIQFVTQIFEWGLQLSLMNRAFDEFGVLRPEFRKFDKEVELVQMLKRRFFWIGLVFLVLSPFVLVALIIYVFFAYTAQIRVSPNLLGSRSWSQLAKWKFRDFNEVHAQFLNRINKAYDSSEKYVDQFQSPVLQVFARFGLFVVGSIVAILVVLTVWKDIFVNAIIVGRSVLWILGIGGTIVGALRMLLPSDHFVFEPNYLMQEIAKHTHYMPLHWIDAAHTSIVRNEFYSFFQYKVIIVLQEILSVVFAPIIFMFSMRRCAPTIVRFLREMTVDIEGVGPMVKFATLDLGQQVGVNDYSITGDAVPVRLSTIDPHWQQEEAPEQTRHGKLEMSVIAFKANYPNWEPESDASKKFIADLNQYQQSDSFIQSLDAEDDRLEARSRLDPEARMENRLEKFTKSLLLSTSDHVRQSRANSYQPPTIALLEKSGAAAAKRRSTFANVAESV